MTQPKKLIEVAMPIKEISAESVRDKNIKTGLPAVHQWWARRPLPVCRAVIFASLVPDPLDENCPQAFKDAVEILLGKENNPGNPYRPYKDIPWTAIYDPMEDNLRNRLQMFIGKFSEEMQEHLLHHKPKPGVKDQLGDSSLIKWDNKNNEDIINKARKLIWIAHYYRFGSLSKGADAKTLLTSFDKHYQAIKNAESELYSLTDRQKLNTQSSQLTANLQQAIEAFLDKMPKVFDPFAGGGAIPLEAARLGCRSFGNDINPVAHIIQKGSLEFPQKYGKPIIYSKEEFIKLYGKEELIKWCIENGKHIDSNGLKIDIPNRLSFDVEFYAKKLLAETEKEIGHFYPADEKGNKPIAYYWARVGTCSNPSCKAEVPLLKGFYLANTKTKQVYLKPIIKGKHIDFEIKKGKCEDEGWNVRGNLKCPCCGSMTDVKQIKQQNINGGLRERLLSVIVVGKNGKEYRFPTKEEKNIVKSIPIPDRPSEKMQRNSAGGDTFSWGVSEWGQLFSNRQVLAIQTFIQELRKIKRQLRFEEEYSKVVLTYLGLFIDKITTFVTSYGRWDVRTELLKSPFSKQAIPMIFDFPETTIFNKSTGGAYTQIKYITDYIKEEGKNPFISICNNATSGDKKQFLEKSITAVITDPPYYDAIAYADLSDFFYVWLKRSLGDVYPLNFATPQTPKEEECTALKHHRNNSYEDAKAHFEKKLTQIFDAIEHQTSDIVTIMFAHQSTEAWTTLCNSILRARMNISGSWAMDTESTSRSLSLNSAVLASSVTVACVPSKMTSIGDYKVVKKAIGNTVAKEVEKLYQLGYRGADLLTACFGQAVSEFGKYEKVEKADGSEVTVAELLEMARESAFNALLKGFDGDDFTKFYIGWLQLYGFAASEHNTAMRIAQVGLTVNIGDIYKEHILLQDKDKVTLASYSERNQLVKHLGERNINFLIDQAHRAMALYKKGNRTTLLQYIDKVGSQTENSFWRVLTSLKEILPTGSDDHIQASGLLTNKDSLIRESMHTKKPIISQSNLFEEN